MNLQPHLKITADDISQYVLLPGDPARVDLIGQFLEDFKIISENREYKIGIGKYKNKLITVCSTGIGCPSTAIAVEELINAGAIYLVRIGTCGGAWKSDISAGSLIIPTASIRDEGTTQEYIPKGFPAVANFRIVSNLVGSAKKQNVKYFIGINRTHDAFYGSRSDIFKWGAYLREERWKNYDTPIVSSEMEAAALFIIASLRNAKAGAILAVNADPEPLKSRLFGKKLKVVTEKDKETSQQTIEKMIKVALGAIICM